jgi:hypothetical protein
MPRPDQINPHAGIGGQNPHAGMDMNDPHAGLDMNDPHAGMEMDNPHAGMDVSQLGLEAPDPDRAIDPTRYLKGTLKPTAATRDAIKSGAVIYFSVKRADPQSGNPTGSPLAVKRMRFDTWPMWFHINEEDAMVAGTAFGGDVVITAWTDADEDAITRQPGDVIGSTRATIPASDVELSLSEQIP